MDANTIIPDSKIFRYKDSKSYAGFADLFRYKLLLEKGGFWVDLDVVCLKPLLISNEFVFASERKRFKGLQVNNCLIGGPKGCEIMEFCYNSAVSKDPNELQWGVTGPKLLTEAVNKFRLWKYVTKPEVFCPVNWWDVADFTSKPLSDITGANTYTVHFYNESWKNRTIDKEKIYDENCCYEALFKRYSSI